MRQKNERKNYFWDKGKNMVTLEQSVEKCRDFLAKMKGAEIKIADRAKLIDLLNFEVLKTEETEKEFIIECRLKENLFSDSFAEYKINIDKESGEIKNILRKGGDDEK